MTVSPQTLHFLEKEEGCKLQAYQDSRGIWTIAMGLTTIYGRPVRKGDVLTQAEADRLSGLAVAYFQGHVLAMIVPAIRAQLTENQITALVSLAFNIGLDENHNGIAEGLGDSTLLKKLNTGDFKGAADEFLKWTRAGSNKTLLLARRKRERSLFLS